MSKAAYNVYAAGGAVTPTYIEDVFSTYLYTGTGATQTITNGIDLSTKGGLIWTKARSAADGSVLIDSAQGVTKYLTSVNSNGAANSSGTQNIYAFSTTGYSLGTNESGATTLNTSAATYVSWTFRKQAKFFDIVTYTGNGVSGRAIPHNLGAIPRFIIVKRTDASAEWRVYAYTPIGPQSFNLALNTTGADGQVTGGYIGDPSATTFPVNEWSGNISVVNASGGTYVAYLFASNAGGFGLTGSDNVISCGTYTGTGAAGNAITLGYEPQWLMIKRTDAANVWHMQDIMRGSPVSVGSALLYANQTNAEFSSGANPEAFPTSTGFTLQQNSASVNASGGTYIYIAIRRGPMKVPTLGTSVFKAIARTGTGSATTITGVGFSPDSVIARAKATAGLNTTWMSRLTHSAQLYTNFTSSGASSSTQQITSYDMDGISVGTDVAQSGFNSSSDPLINWYFKRAPSFFDEVCWTGDGVSNRALAHNLGVVPELIITKGRSTAADWQTYNSFTTTDYARLVLNTTAANTTGITYGFGVNLYSQPTASNIYLTPFFPNSSGDTFVAYLFATCAGVSKVGTFNGSASQLDIDCGFTAGARFVLIKKTNATGDWWVFDTARGIVSGADYWLRLNLTTEEGSGDVIDPYSAGFSLVGNTAVNDAGSSYIFLAIA